MQRLIAFLFARRAFLFFLFLQVICFWLIVKNNAYHGEAYYTSSNKISGSIYASKQEFVDYFQLKKLNNELVKENSEYKEFIYQKRNAHPRTSNYSDPFLKRLTYVPAKVINNSVYRSHNYLTLNVGKRQGVRVGMGVITKNGIVGRVKACSDNFTTVTSLLHPNMNISAMHKSSGYPCTINWNTKNPKSANVLYIPRHISVNKGDSIFTSSFNVVFPEEILIGVVDEFIIKPDQSFYSIDMKLSQDLSSLNYVYVVENKLKPEQKQLEVTDEE